MFKIKRLPANIVILLSELEHLFNDIQWMHFQSLLISLLITPYKSTICGMVKVLGFGTHRSKHNAFMINFPDIMSKALRYYAHFILSILKKPGEELYIIFDDTSNKKRGKHIIGAFNYFDHLSKTFIWGQQIVCCIISYRGFTIPYCFDIYISKEQCKSLGIKFKKKTQIVLEQLKSFEVDTNQTVYVLTDTFYANEPMMNHCRSKKYHFVTALKYNRVFEVNNRQTNVSKYIKYHIKTFKNKTKIKLKNTTYSTVSEKVILKTGGAGKLVISKHPTHCTAMALFTTTPALPVLKILQAYQKRWSIEVFFKMSKQHLGFNKYQSRKLESVQSQITFSMLAYNLLTHAYINDLRAKGKSLTKKNISNFSILNMLTEIRYQTNIDTMDYCIDNLNIKSKNKIKNEFKNLLNKAA